jgi:hypothetical protein
MNIRELYAERCQKPSSYDDIWEHLPTLKRYAEQAKHITEIGTRTGNSTTGLLMGLSVWGGEMHSYDISPQRFTPPEITGVSWFFHQQDTHLPDFRIAPTELLFIDGCHKYESVKADLRQAEYVSRFILLHDTLQSRDDKFGDGVVPAMMEFLSVSPFKIRESFTNCNGLTVLERIK